MIILLVLSIIAFVSIMLFVKRLKISIRLALAMAIFILINLPTILLLIVGDQLPPGAKIVTPEEISSNE